MNINHALLSLVAIVALPSAFAIAATDSQKCTSAKERAAGVYAKCRLAAESRFAKNQDQLRLDLSLEKCSSKLTKQFESADERYGLNCPTSGDVGDVESFLGATSDQLVEYLTTGSSELGAGFCDEADTVFDPVSGKCVSLVACGEGTTYSELSEECEPNALILTSATPPPGYNLFLSTSDDSWSARPPMPAPRWFLGAASVDDKIYIVGGAGGSGTLDEYDPASQVWTPKAPLGTPRYGHATVAHAGKIYVIGGYNGGQISSVEQYDPQLDAWTPRAPMPTAREQLAAGVIAGKIYAVGGRWNSGTGWLATVEEYDPLTNTWATKTPMPTPRSVLAVAVANGKLYAIGGYSGYAVSAVEEYDPTTDSWTTKSPHGGSYQLAAATINGRIYAVGGKTTSNVLGTLSEFDPASNTWETKTSMPTARAGLAVSVVNNRLYAFGGYDNVASETFATVEVYDPGAFFVYQRD